MVYFSLKIEYFTCVCITPTDLLKQLSEIFPMAASVFPFLPSSRKVIEFDFLWCAFVM